MCECNYALDATGPIEACSWYRQCKCMIIVCFLPMIKYTATLKLTELVLFIHIVFEDWCGRYGLKWRGRTTFVERWRLRQREINTQRQHKCDHWACSLVLAEDALLPNRKQNRIGRYGAAIFQRYRPISVFRLLRNLFIWWFEHLCGGHIEYVARCHLVSRQWMTMEYGSVQANFLLYFCPIQIKAPGMLRSAIEPTTN